MVSWISAGFEHIMSRLGFCLTWRIDVFRDKDTTVSYTSARLRQQVQFFQYWVCKMYIFFGRENSQNMTTKPPAAAAAMASLRWFSRWKLQVQSGGGRLFGRLKRGRSGHWVETPISPIEGWESSNLFPADQPFTEHLLCVFPRFLLRQLTGLRKQIYDSSVLVWIGVKIKLWPAFSRGRGRLEDFLRWVVSTFFCLS